MFDLLLVYWAGRQKQELVTKMEHGAAILKSVALRFHQQVQQKGDDSRLSSRLEGFSSSLLGSQSSLACVPWQPYLACNKSGQFSVLASNVSLKPVVCWVWHSHGCFSGGALCACAGRQVMVSGLKLGR